MVANPILDIGRDMGCNCGKPVVRAGVIERRLIVATDLGTVKASVKLDSSAVDPQPTKEKKAYEATYPVSLTTARVEFDDATVELVEGQPIAGLTRQERDHLRFWGFIT